MFLVKFMGTMDFLAAVNLLLLHFGVLDWHIGLYSWVYLVLKGIYFFGDFASFIDLLTAFYMLFIFMGAHTFIVYIFFLYLMQKAYLSFQ